MKNYKSLFFIVIAISGFKVSSQVLELRGVVRDSETGLGISQAVIEVHENERSTLSDLEGSFSINLLKGRYHLHLSALGYEAMEADVFLNADTLVSFFLKPTFVELTEVLVEDRLSKTSGKKLTQDVEQLNLDEGAKAESATLSESISKIAGVEAYNTGVGIAKPVIRGFTATRISVYDQGVKQEGQQWGMDHGLEIDPFSAGRIEIVKGAGALQYGSDALGGVVKMLPDPIPQEGVSGALMGVYKSNNGTLGSSLKLDYRKAKHFAGLRLSVQKYDDFRVPADQFTYNGYVLPIVDNRLKNTAGNLGSFRLNYGYVGEKLNVRLLASQYEQNAGLYPGATGVPRAYDIADIGEVGDIDLPNQSVKHSKFYGSFNFKIRNNWLITDVGFQRNVRRENSNPHAHGYQQIDENNTTALGLDLNTLSLNSSYNWVTKKIKYVVGINQELQQNRKSGWEYLLPDFDRYNGGAFMMLNGELGSKLNWSGGLRLDYGYISSQKHLQPWFNDPDSLVERSPQLKRHFYNYAAALGLSYNPNDGWNFKVNLAKSFRIPVPAELVSNGVHHGTFRHEMGNPDLDPEEGYQLDLAAVYSKKAFYVKLTPFVNYFTNYIYLRPSGQFSPLPDAGQVYIYSQAKALHTGAELFAEVHPVERLHISTALEYVYNLNLETGLPLPFTPPLSNLFCVDYDITKGKKANWSISGEYRATAAQERVDRNERQTPGYNLFNAKTNVELKLGNRKLDVSLAALNLFDTAYLSHLSRYRILNLPEQGRNFIISVSFIF